MPRIPVEQAIAEIKEHLDTVADADDVASVYARHLSDDPVVVGCDEGRSSDLFVDGERARSTSITYLYRDGANYKLAHTVVVLGELRFDDIEEFLDEGRYFIASQVGLPDVQLLWREKGFAFPTTDDHVFCEIAEADVVVGSALPTIELTAAGLLDAFRRAGHWNVPAAMERLGLS